LTVGAGTWRVQTVKARHARGNELVREAYELLAYEDYHESEAAKAKLSVAIGLGPDEWDYRRALGFANLGTDQGKAIEHLTWAASQRPNDTTTMYLLAYALRVKAGRLDPTAKQWLDKADSLGGATTAEAHFFRGQALVREEDQAEEEYRKARMMKPDYTQALLHLGRALNHWMYHHRKHDKYFEQRQCLEAVSLVQADRAYPRYLLSLAHRISAEVHQEANNMVDAEEDFESALKYARSAQSLEPSNPRGYIAESEYWETRRNYRKAIELRNQSEPFCTELERVAELHQYRWRLNYWAGEYDRALADLEQMSRLPGTSESVRGWYLSLFPSLIAADQGRLEDAIRLNHAMAANQPTNFRAVTSAACMLRMFGRGAEADRILSEHADRIIFDPSGEAEINPVFMRNAYELCHKKTMFDSVVGSVAQGQRERLIVAVPSFYAAAEALANGDRRAFLNYFKTCEQSFDSDDYCYLARVFVRKMEIDPAWPRWGEAGKH
jgi:tetratricopeptide (TPR) repeat protein